MTIQYINTGSSANAGNGDSLRSAFNKVNNNFEYLSTATFGSSTGNGYTGSQGVVGFTGSQGNIGYTGSQGVVGFVGSQGDIGYTGSAVGTVSPGTAGRFAFYDGTGDVLSEAPNIELLADRNNLVIGGQFTNLTYFKNSYSADLTSGFNIMQHHETQDANNTSFVRTRGVRTARTPVFAQDDVADIVFAVLNQSNTYNAVSAITVSVESTSTGLAAGGMYFYTHDGINLNLAARLTSSSTFETSKLAPVTGTTVSMAGDFIPAADLTYDLGSTSSQWRSLYVGTSTIYLGGTALSVSGGNLTVDGSPVAGGGDATRLYGNVDTDINVTVQHRPTVSAECYIANGDEFVADIEFNDDVTVVQVGWQINTGSPSAPIWVTVTAIDPTPPANQYRITVADFTFVQGETYTFTDPTATAQSWTFNDTGELTTPGEGTISHQNNDFKLEVSGSDVIVLRTSGGDTVVTSDGDLQLGGNIITQGIVELTDIGTVTAYSTGTATYITLRGSINNGVALRSTDSQLITKEWLFGTDGSLTFPSVVGGAEILAPDGLLVQVDNGGQFSLRWEADGTQLPGETITSSAIAFDYPGISIAVDTTNSNYSWNFGPDGRLTLPGGEAWVEVSGSGGVSILEGEYAFDDIPVAAIKIGGTEGDAFTISSYDDLVKTWLFNHNGNLTVPGSIIPSTDVAYDLGSPTNRFKDLYLSTSTIYLGDATISATGSAIELPVGTTTGGVSIGTIIILGSVADSTALTAISTATLAVGDSYVVASPAPAHLWTYNGQEFIDLGVFQGPQGELGYTGSQGFTGSRGFTGSQGATGYVGSQGVTGFVGSLGYTGSAGAGFTGSSGEPGATGFTGSAGSSGEMGFTGSTGPSGAGFTGSSGEPGATGFTGSKGETGPAGMGFTGSTGATGFTGSAGSSGEMGFTGSTGASGEPGATGFTGSFGFTGSTGPSGAGFTGSTGATGFTGSKGETGPAGMGFTGSTGATGFTGSFGFTGSTGPAGMGFTGSTGATGFTGSKGDTGSSGFGFTGSTGATGFTGSFGFTGSTGSPGTISWSISASGTSDYVFSGPGIVTGNTNDPVLYLYRGFTYTFVNTTGGTHPFAIRVSNGGADYTDGVSGSQTGTQTFTVPMNVPSTLYYQCTIHSGMGNVINIV